MNKASLILGAGLITAAVVAVVVISSGGGTKVDSTKASFKILGTWVKVVDPTNKSVFTADSVKEISGGHPPKTYKYNWINEQEMDITIDTDKKARMKITIDGDSLTMSLNGNEVKLIREEAYTANAATTDKKGDISLTPEATSNEVTIATQVWMAQNLNVDTFRNGDPIPEVKTSEEWKNAGRNGEPAWCYYDNDPANGEKYGKLYNWYAVNDSSGLAPKGWHVPSDKEWTILTDFLGGEEVAGTKMKSKSGWQKNGNGTNESGFSGLTGGGRGSDGLLTTVGYGCWWSSTEDGTAGAWCRNLHYGDGGFGRSYESKRDGYSVRCLRD